MELQHRPGLNARPASILMLVVFLLLPISLFGGECDPWIAQILSAQGRVEVIRAGSSRAEGVSPGKTRLCPGDTLRADTFSKATMLLANQTRATVDEATEFTLPEVATSNPDCRRPGSRNRPLLEILKGAIRFISRTPTSLEVCAPYVNAAIEGTEFVVRANPAQSYVWVSEGRVVASNALGSLSLNPGEGAVAIAGAVLRRITIKPEDATQWSLYYPPVIDYRARAYATGPAASNMANAIAEYRNNDLPAVFTELQEVPEAHRNADYFTLRAGLQLSVGRVEEALADTEQALRIDPAHGKAYALQSIVAVTQNRSEQALALAQRAQQLDTKSSVPEIALSYAHQARFDIEKARQSVRRAVALSPQDALAWSRLAELELSLGYLHEALAAAEKAEQLDPDLSRTQSVLGFARLAQFDINGAKSAFGAAIERDPAAPLPRLGLGLATIRQGELDGGTKEIETSAILDPDNSLVRSYLSKAYYEQKRGGLAAAEFDIAKELDPNDPTPWFYDAIRKQTSNRPVEALHDIQNAIELNDNRAVYRSSLLLDQDEAARSASLGRIYNDLGFEQLGLVEGWKSVHTDPSNYSAHRLLADNYAALPRHEIARVSELLQSQLLQPVNINPVQPSLAESNLLILEGSGPSDSSFNEFNPLFTRNRMALQASGTYGSRDTLGDEVTLSGVWEGSSFSLGQFHFETDGFRKNNDQEWDIYNAFFQRTISANTSVQAEYRYSAVDFGDLALRFNPETFAEGRRENQIRRVVRVGGNHAFTPSSVVLGSVIYQNLNIEQDDIDSGFDRKDDGVTVELQHQFRNPAWSLISGVGNFDGDSELEGVLSRDPFLCSLIACEIIENEDIRHTSAYTYLHLRYPSKQTWTIGLSVDDVHNELVDSTKLNPKFGLTLPLNSSSTIRLAAFRTLKKELVANQTLEPTQVAGFNQFFDELRSTAAWRYGAALDQKISERTFGGIEFSQRDLDVPFQETDSLTSAEADWREQFGRMYLYWTPFPWLSTSLEYFIERFTTERKLADEDVLDLKTHRVPLTIRLYDPSGLNAHLRLTYAEQEGTFFDTITESVTQDDVDFWVVDAGLNYRLPKRTGILSIQVKNLFNNSFRFQDAIPGTPTTSFDQPTYARERLVFVKFTLGF